MQAGGRSGPPRSVATRIGSQGAPGGAPFWVTGAWTLRLLPFLLVPPMLTALVAGRAGPAAAGIGAMAAMWVASGLMRRGLAAEADYHAREIARAPRLPRKLLASLLYAAAIFVFALWGSAGGLFGLGAATGVGLALLFAALGFAGCVLAYGTDPKRDKGVAPEVTRRSGVRTEQVVAAVAEAEAKIRDIETAARGLHSLELKTRLRRIVEQARAVLRQIERDPRDLARARRFLVTYLDGTRDVVRKYAAQQRDLADTPLAESFRRVLTTIEQVFLEQEEVLKRNDVLDLDVQIEVLETQLKREGVV
jgi:5-bromo-4-chloroindolyl phosphate hydrolysis protein